RRASDLLLRLFDEGNGPRVIVDGLLVALAPTKDRANCIEDAQIVRVLLKQPIQQRFGLVWPFEKVQVESLADLDGGIERGAGWDLLVCVDRLLVALGGLVEIGQRRECKREVR